MSNLLSTQYKIYQIREHSLYMFNRGGACKGGRGKGSKDGRVSKAVETLVGQPTVYMKLFEPSIQRAMYLKYLLY